MVSSTDSTTAFDVKNSGGTTKFLVDTSNNYVKANGVHVNTQYATFSVGNTELRTALADTHYGLLFQTGDLGSAPVAFGTGTEPATSFTTAEASDTRASDIVPLLWYVPDAISIDSVIGIEGADAATGDVTRMHLYSYDFTSGATNCLTNGTLLAHNSDVLNGGSEQPYKSTFTVDSASVAADKVILAFLRADTVNSDYSIKLICKYHVTG